MPWWPRFIVRPRLNLKRPKLGTVSRPPDMVIFGFIFVLYVFVVGGNIFALVKTPPAVVSGSSGPVVVYPTPDFQLGLEGFVVAVLVFFGSLGLGLLYHASRLVFQPGRATRYMLIAILMLGITVVLMMYLMSLKTAYG
ncbi:MAG: hypothetical protein QXS20_01025 [Candidatus Thorarchaeota archaeon]